jgi:protein gp37
MAVAKSGIEWTDSTWSPVTGCTKVSAGCDNCYAESIAHRFAGTPAFPNGFDVTLRPERLDQPLRWKRPRRIFVNSMSDLFHGDIPDEYIAKVFAVMALAPQHTFQILTKRHGRMRSLLNDAWWFETLLPELIHRLADGRGYEVRYPLPNVWLGVSVEDQKAADLRIPALLATPAAVRFISAEPLLGPVSLGSLEPCDHKRQSHIDIGCWRALDWVIAGGESGPNARPMHPDWARRLRDECQAAGTAFLFKQWGEWKPWNGASDTHLLQTTGQLITRESGTMRSGPGRPQDLVDRGHPGWVRISRVGKKRAGRELDGRTWDEFPKAVAS